MENIEVVNAQPNNDIIVDGIQSHMHEKLWNLCAGPLSQLPKPGEKVYYFPQGHIELIEESTRQDLDQIKPLFDLPSKLLCRVVSIQLKAEKNTDEIYAEISLIPDTTRVITPIPNGNQHIPIVHHFTKILTASDTSTHGGLSIPRRHATECLPPLDMSQPTPTQEIVAKDIHGNEWMFKHTFRGTPPRHLFTTGWSDFATAKKLVAGDSFVFLRGENGELRVGIRRVRHQQDDIPLSVISPQCMMDGVISSTVNAFNNQCIFIVFYKPRLSQFVVNYKKVVDAMNNNFNVGSRFRMQYEGEDLSERRYSGTVIGVNDLSPHWKNSEWRMLQVQWDDLTSFSRPNKVSPWEIEHVLPSSNILQLNIPKKKRSRKLNEIGSTSSNLWTSQEIGQSSKTSPPLLFGVDLTKPSEINDPMRPVESYKKSEISKLSHDIFPDHNQTLNSLKEVQSKQFNTTRSRTKVQMQGVAIGRAVDLTILNGYTQLREKLEELFDIKSEECNQWEIIFMDNEGDLMLVGDYPWLEFCNMVKKIFICSKEEVKKMKSGKKSPKQN